jgi:hypothetical protein
MLRPPVEGGQAVSSRTDESWNDLEGSIPPRSADEDPVRVAKRWFETQGFDVDTCRHEGQWIATARVGKLGDQLIGRGGTEEAAMHDLQRAYRPANTDRSQGLR